MFLIWLVQLLVIYKTFDKNNQLIISSHYSLGVTMTTLKIYDDACNILVKIYLKKHNLDNIKRLCLYMCVREREIVNLKKLKSRNMIIYS
jgi:hypothetical protein